MSTSVVRRKAKAFDKIDILIIAALESDPRATMVRLTREVPLSRTAIAKRLQRIRSRGLLSTDVRPSLYRDLGLEIEAVVEIDVPSDKQSTIICALLEFPCVLRISRTLGVENLRCHVVARQMADLSRFVAWAESLGRVSTNLVMNTRFSSKPFPSRVAAIKQNAKKHGQLR